MNKAIRIALASAVTLLAAFATAEAQWLKLPTPGIPRLPDGKPNLTAPAPMTADGKPDFSGIWRTPTGKYLENLAAGWTRNSMKPGDVVTVEGFRARNGTRNGNATAIVLTSTGQRLFAASSQGQ